MGTPGGATSPERNPTPAGGAGTSKRTGTNSRTRWTEIRHMEEVEVEQERAQQQETEPPVRQDPPVMQDLPARHDSPAKRTPPARKPIGIGSMDAPNCNNCNEDNIIPSQGGEDAPGAAEEIQCIQQRWIKETSEQG